MEDKYRPMESISCITLFNQPHLVLAEGLL